MQIFTLLNIIDSHLTVNYIYEHVYILSIYIYIYWFYYYYHMKTLIIGQIQIVINSVNIINIKWYSLLKIVEKGI